MSIRVSILLLLVVALAVYAWKDWFKALCGLIVMMAVFSHPDMPRSVAGIPGLNPWNALMAVIIAAWLVGRHHDGLRWDMDRRTTVVVVLFMGMVLVGFVRMMFEREQLHQPTGRLIIDYGLNVFKWLIPAILLFDGCRSRKQAGWVVLSLMALSVLLALQAAKYAPVAAAFDRDALEASRRVVFKNTGYHTCDLGPILAGASWAFLASMGLFARRWLRWACVGAGLLATYGMVVCGARAGMLAWAVTGLVFCLLRWRKLLLLAPVAPVLVLMFMPSFTNRMLEGFGETDITGGQQTDIYAATSGRAVAWPIMMEGVRRAPIFGYGRCGYITSGVAREVAAVDTSFPHPHNMFIQLWLDNGVVGGLPAYLLFGGALVFGAKLLRARGDPLLTAIGGWCLGLTCAVLVGGVGAMTFYPRESLVGMFCAILLSLRARQSWLARRRAEARAVVPSAWSRQTWQPT